MTTHQQTAARMKCGVQLALFSTMVSIVAKYFEIHQQNTKSELWNVHEI